MKRIKYVAAILALLALGFASTQAMQRSQRPERAPKGPGLLAMAEQLGLSSDQEMKLRETRLETRKEAIELNAKVRILRLELRELLQADQPDQKTVQAKVEEIGKLRTRLEMTRLNGLLAAKSVLTAEQRDKLKELRKERLRRRFERPRFERPRFERPRFERPPRPMRPGQPIPHEGGLEG